MSVETLRERWAMRLETRKRDGSVVATAVNVAVEDGRAYFATPEITAKVKRLRNFPDVRVCASTVTGKPRGPVIEARARRLAGDEAEAAERRLHSRYPFVRSVMVPLELRKRGCAEAFYELTAG
jgi:PPOX class probable F420-dependent enzyme